MLYHDIVNGKNCVCIPLGFQVAKYIEDVVELTRDLTFQNRSQCAPGKFSVQCNSLKLDVRLQRALWLTPEQLHENFPKHLLHPYVALFVQCCAKERLYDYRTLRSALSKAEHKQYAAARQRMLATLRAGTHDPAFRKTVKAHQDKVRRNLNCIRRYTDAQFRYSRILVIRVDCMWNKGFTPAHDWIQARSYREALIKFLNRDFPKLIQSNKSRESKRRPDPICGYIIGTEYGIETGWHFHVTLFLNGDDHLNDVGIATLIGLTWMKQITESNGRYYNCNLAAKQGRYLQVGIGMVHRHDSAKREILKDVVCRYAVKGCYYAEAQTGTKDRLLNKGGWPKEKDPKKGGRPERARQPQSVLLARVFSEKTKRFSTIWGLREASQPRVSY
jgi:hypothetical protein